MSSEFMNQFMGGWQMGMQRLRNQQMQEQEAYQRQQDAIRLQQEQEDRAMRMEQFKLQKQQLDLQMKEEKFKAAMQDKAMREEALKYQGMPDPTAAEIGVPQQSPEMAGPTPDQINVPQPMQAVPAMAGGPDIQMPVLTGRQQQEEALAEQQRKMREALGLERAKLEVAEPFKVAADQRRAEAQAAAAKARGKEISGILGAFGTAKTEGQQKGVEIAQYAIGKMPEWQQFIKDNKDKFGFYAGRYTKAVQSGALSPLGIEADEKMASFTSGLANMSSAMLNALSGAAISPAEFERLKQFIPQVEDPPNVLNSKMSELDKFFKFRLKNFNAPYQGTGWQEPPPGAPQGGMSPEAAGRLIGSFYGADVYEIPEEP